MPKPNSAASAEALAADPTEDAIPKPQDDAPTEPAIQQEDEAQVRQLAGRARTVDIEPEASAPPASAGGIDPSADAGVLSDMVKPVARPADPTDPLPPAPPPRPAPLALIVAAAAAATLGIYAWTVFSPGEPEPRPPAEQARAPETAVRPLPLPPKPSSDTPTLVRSTVSAPAVPDRLSAKADRLSAKAVPSPAASRSAQVTGPAPAKVTPKPTRTPEAPKAAQTKTAPQPAPPKDAPPPPTKTTEPPRASKQDVDVAAKDYAWGDCVKGVQRACIALAKQHERLGHWRAAAKSRDQACRHGHRGSCLTAAAHYLKANQGRTARRKYEYLCDNRDARACAELSTLFLRGIGGRKSKRTADAFKLRACQLGHRPSCG